jgi:hypothetical protein
VAEEKINRWARWKSSVEVEHIEPATIPYARPSRQLSCQPNCDGGHVDSPVVHAPLGEPNRSSASAACKFEDMPGRRHEMFNRDKKWRKRRVIEHRRQAAGGIPLVPMLTVCHAHQPNRTRHLGAPALPGSNLERGWAVTDGVIGPRVVDVTGGSITDDAVVALAGWVAVDCGTEMQADTKKAIPPAANAACTARPLGAIWLTDVRAAKKVQVGLLSRAKWLLVDFRLSENDGTKLLCHACEWRVSEGTDWSIGNPLP